jgi:hypothetical protein
VAERLNQLPLVTVAHTSKLRRADLDMGRRSAALLLQQRRLADQPENPPLDWDETSESAT